MISIATTTPAPALPPVPLEVIEFPSGERHEVLVADEHRLVIEFVVPPAEHPNVPHVHDCADELFEVLAGHLRFTLEGIVHHLAPGDSIVIPRATEHRWQVIGEVPMYARVTFTPGCEVHTFLRDYAALVRAGRIRPSGRPGLRDVALLSRRHRAHLRLTTVPRPVLRALIGLGLAGAALTGRRLP